MNNSTLFKIGDVIAIKSFRGGARKYNNCKGIITDILWDHVVHSKEPELFYHIDWITPDSEGKFLNELFLVCFIDKIKKGNFFLL